MPGRPTIPAGSGVHLTGDKALMRSFKGLTPALQRKALRPATREVAKAAKAHAAAHAPEDTGAMVASLKVRTAATRRTGKGGRRVTIRKFKDMVGHGVYVGEGLFRGDQFYAGFIEFGTKPRQTKSGANRGRIDEQDTAFLRPALFAQSHKAMPIIAKHVRQFIQSQRAR